jgi:small neutral amino acid transporter SnatA (MarC family)
VSMAEADYILGVDKLFTLFFVTLGPLKLLGPIARSTRMLTEAELRALAVRASALATLIAIAGGFLGRALLESWQIPVFALRLTAGLILFVVAFRLVMQPYESPTQAPPPSEPPGIMSVVFPMVLTPYGLAALIVLLVLSHGAARTAVIVGVLLAVMLLNLLTMAFVRQVLPVIGPVLAAVGVVLGVLQLALAVQIILTALRGLGVLAGTA